MEKKAGIGKRLLSMLLAAAFIVTAQGMPVFAGTYDELTDMATWDYVTFGSYPQSEVTGEALTEEIIQAVYDEAGDAWVDGVKYRRISREDTDNSDYFGGEDYRYFKWEKLKWRVLQQDENGIQTVMADQGIDCKKYNDENTNVSWEISSIHEWLNNTFYNTAFSSSEQKAIPSDTSGRVSLLSEEQAVNTEYGFSGEAESISQSRRMKASDYANARGAYVSSQSGYEGNCWWWLRNSSFDSVATRIKQDGAIEASGYGVNNTYGAVVPVLQLNSGSINSLSPEYDSSTDTTRWNYISFGDYPQTKVDPETERILYVQLENATYDSDENVEIENVKYRRVLSNSQVSSGAASNYDYFRWEPITWKVLKENENTLFVMADQALDARTYNDESVSVTWEGCSLRRWLNDEFYNSAFDWSERNAIVQQTVANDGNPSYSTNGGNYTSDNVYLLSIQEAESSVYGFTGSASETSSRQVQVSDYAYQEMEEYTDSEGNGRWWLRSPGCISTYAAMVGNTGNVDRYGDMGDSAAKAVVPVLHISRTATSVWSAVENEGQSLRVSFGSGTYSSMQVSAGDSVTFSVTATGGHPFGSTCQWYYASSADEEGTRIDGATSLSYTIDNTDAARSGSYYCVVTSGRYQVSSGRITLTVTEGGIDSTPDDASTITGLALDKTSLSLQVGGTGALTASISPASAQATVSWKSSNENIAKLEVNGENKATVTAVQEGSATITAAAGGQEAFCVVNVTAKTVTDPSASPTPAPTVSPTPAPTVSPTSAPTVSPTPAPKPSTKLAAPKLTVKLVSANAVKLSWKKISGASGYYVYRATSKYGKYSKIGTTKKTSFKNSKLKSKKTYYYKIAAYNGNKTSAQSNVASKKILGKPSTPKMKLTNKASEQKFTISWNKIKNASKVEIWRKIDRNGSYKKWKTVSANKRKVTYSYRSYTRGHNYFYQIRAYYTKDKVKVYSGYSKGLGIPL